MDVICVFSDEGVPYCTPFFVKLKSSVIDSAIVSVLGVNKDNGHESLQNEPQDALFPTANQQKIDEAAMRFFSTQYPALKRDFLEISCNNKVCSDIIAFVGQEQFLFFYDKVRNSYSKMPTVGIIGQLNLQVGKNKVECLHRASGERKEFSIWRYSYRDKLVIMDIDGTITKSDITGYIQTVYMGLFSYVHDGIVPFLNALAHTYGCKIVYLTARPLAHQKETKLLLQNIHDSSGHSIPDGPLCPSTDKILQALYREMISKTTMQLKVDLLNGINAVFRAAGCEKISPFVLGVGNKEADALAYNLAGIHAEHIFLIDPQSKIEVWKYMTPKKGSGKYDARSSRHSTSGVVSGFSSALFGSRGPSGGGDSSSRCGVVSEKGRLRSHSEDGPPPSPKMMSPRMFVYEADNNNNSTEEEVEGGVREQTFGGSASERLLGGVSDAQSEECGNFSFGSSMNTLQDISNISANEAGGINDMRGMTANSSNNSHTSSITSTATISKTGDSSISSGGLTKPSFSRGVSLTLARLGGHEEEEAAGAGKELLSTSNGRYSFNTYRDGKLMSYLQELVVLTETETENEYRHV
jgi:hypothetical protein